MLGAHTAPSDGEGRPLANNTLAPLHQVRGIHPLGKYLSQALPLREGVPLSPCQVWGLGEGEIIAF